MHLPDDGDEAASVQIRGYDLFPYHRVEQRLRSAAGTLSASGRKEFGLVAERFADAVHFDREHPAVAQQFYHLLVDLKRADDAGSVYLKALNGALQLAGADRGNLQLRQRSTGSLVIVAQQGFDKEFLEYFAVTEDDASACGRASKNRSQVVIADVKRDPRFAPHRDIALASGFRGVCSTPLLDHRGNVVGVMSTHYERPYHPTRRELELLRRLGYVFGSLLLEGDKPMNSGVARPLQGANGRTPNSYVEEWRHAYVAIAEETADLAEKLASVLETAARRGYEQRRLRLATTERQIAAVHRRNAVRLRQSGWGSVRLERLPSFLD